LLETQIIKITNNAHQVNNIGNALEKIGTHLETCLRLAGTRHWKITSNKLFQYETIHWFTLKQNPISIQIHILYKFE
jgi:hypothetical protein